jgi:hypothetical protein
VIWRPFSFNAPAIAGALHYLASTVTLHDVVLNDVGVAYQHDVRMRVRRRVWRVR